MLKSPWESVKTILSWKILGQSNFETIRRKLRVIRATNAHSIFRKLFLVKLAVRSLLGTVCPWELI